MLLVDQTKTISNMWRAFPNAGHYTGDTSLEGYYEPVSHTVNLPANTKSEFEDALAEATGPNPNSESTRKIFSVGTHELTHWLDHVSTLWGQHSLADIYNAFAAVERNDPQSFWRIIEFESNRRRDHLADYYTVVEDGANQLAANRPWKAMPTCGMEFGSDGRLRKERPIVFYRLSTRSERPLCRVPLTVASLLEANATWTELVTYSELSVSSDQVMMQIDARIFGDQFMSRVYNPSLGLYSVTAHLTANVINITEVVTSYRVASIFSNICLNLPSSLFDELHIPESLKPWKEAIPHLIKLRDRGFAFYLLCLAAPSYPIDHASPYTDTDIIQDWVDATLRAAGLPDHDTIRDLALKEMEEIPNDVLDSNRRQCFDHLHEIGKHNLKIRGIYGQKTLAPYSLTNNRDFRLPYVVLGDEAGVHWGADVVDPSVCHIPDLIDHATKFTNKASEFTRACRP